MKNVTLSSFALSLVLLTTGCGEPKSLITQDLTEPENDPKPETIEDPDTYSRQLLSATNELADLYESVKDMDSAVKEKARLEALIQRMQKIEARGKGLKIDALPLQQKEALDKKYKGPQEKAYWRAVVASQSHSPAVQKFLKQVEQNAVAK